MDFANDFIMEKDNAEDIQGNCIKVVVRICYYYYTKFFVRIRSCCYFQLSFIIAPIILLILSFTPSISELFTS